jgi:hypothetical protein
MSKVSVGCHYRGKLRLKQEHHTEVTMLPMIFPVLFAWFAGVSLACPGEYPNFNASAPNAGTAILEPW